MKRKALTEDEQKDEEPSPLKRVRSQNPESLSIDSYIQLA